MEIARLLLHGKSFAKALQKLCRYAFVPIPCPKNFREVFQLSNLEGKLGFLVGGERYDVFERMKWF